MPTDAEIEKELREAVDGALNDLRGKLTAYWRGCKRPPSFILEGGAPELKDEAVQDCRMFGSRFSMLKALAKGEVAAEVGTQLGNFAKFILDNTTVKELHLFDLNFTNTRADVKSAAGVHLHEGNSASTLATLPDGHFDWIYIDAGHSYSNVRNDSIEAAKKVKQDGVLIFNDYAIWSPLEAIPYGVVKRVNELLNQDWKLVGFALTSTGYFDAAIARR